MAKKTAKRRRREGNERDDIFWRKKNFSDGSWIHTNQFSLKKFRRRAAEGRGGLVLVVVVVVVVGVVGRQQKKCIASALQYADLFALRYDYDGRAPKPDFQSSASAAMLISFTVFFCNLNESSLA